MRVLPWTAVLLLTAAAFASQEKTASVDGQVLKYGSREPVAGVAVELIPEGGAAPIAPSPQPLPAAAQNAAARIVATTDADGAFHLREIPAGTYRLYGTALNGYLPAEFGQRTPTGVGMTVELKAGQAATGVTLTITPTASISGRVTDAAGDPVVFANVIAGRVVYRNGVRTLEAAQSSMTNDRGEYRIFWLAPGTYVVDAIPLEMRGYNMPATPPSRFGGREHISLPLIALRPSPDGGEPVEVTYMPSYFPGVGDIRSAQRITVHPGESLRADINAGPSEVPSLRVRGVVIGVDGRPAANLRLTLVPRYAEGHSVQPPGGAADQNGAFDIHGVVPGSYLLFAGTTAMPVEVGEKGASNVRVQLMNPVTIPWRVTVLESARGSEDKPVNVQVSLTREPNLAGAPGAQSVAGPIALPAGTAAAARGRGGATPQQTVLQNVGSGDYRVSVTGLPPNTYVRSIRLGGDDVLRDGLHVYGPIENTLEIALSETAGTLEGVVVDENRRPVVNAVVVLVPPPDRRQSRVDLYRTAASGWDGRFRLAGLPPGEYKVFAWEEVQTGDWFNPDFMQKEEIRGVTVRIGESATESVAIPVIPVEGSAR